MQKMGESDCRFSYVDEPASPFISFYSSPASTEYCFSPSYSQSATPWEFEDANSSFDDFEFCTSRRLDLDIDFEERIDVQKQQENDDKKLEIPLPEMAFADELFSDGKVLPLHHSLKLPPRLQHYNIDDGSKKNTTVASPRYPISALKSKISKSYSLDSSFDPFMVALENVRGDDDRGKTLDGKPNIKLGPKAQLNATTVGPRSISLGMSGLTSPKGLSIARKIRLVQMGFESNLGPLEDPAEDKNGNTEEIKGQKWNFSSFRVKKPTFLKKLKRKSGGVSEDKKVKETTRMTVVRYRPKLPLCLGLRPKITD